MKTIAAIATPMGTGAISIIRVSGENAFDIVNKIFSEDLRSYKTHSAHLGKILHHNEIVDEVLVLVMDKNRSYTGFQTVEIMCHGGIFVTKKILKILLENGADLAKPGEFTYRAFLNGKIDIIQSKAVDNIINAKSNLALRCAQQELQGNVSKEVLFLKQEILDVLSTLEASIEYPDEEFYTKDAIANLTKIKEKIEKQLSTFDLGKKIYQGFEISLLGVPNVGKSLLTNALLNKNRSIVTDIPGTTRDLISEEVNVGGLSFLLKDSAGIRESNCSIEREGVRRSIESAKNADLVIIVLDGNRNISEVEKSFLKEFKDAIVVINKIDLTNQLVLPRGIRVSAKTLEGIDILKNRLVEHFEQTDTSEVIITGEQHFAKLNISLSAINRALQEKEEVLIADNLHSALKALDEIVKGNSNVMGEIFSKFCVGK